MHVCHSMSICGCRRHIGISCWEISGIRCSTPKRLTSLSPKPTDVPKAFCLSFLSTALVREPWQRTRTKWGSWMFLGLVLNGKPKKPSEATYVPKMKKMNRLFCFQMATRKRWKLHAFPMSMPFSKSFWEKLLKLMANHSHPSILFENSWRICMNDAAALVWMKVRWLQIPGTSENSLAWWRWRSEKRKWVKKLAINVELWIIKSIIDPYIYI